MKLSDTFALAGLAANFNGASALDSSDLITDDGIIWNSDKSLCLKMSGFVFDNQKPDFSAISDKEKRQKAKRAVKRDTCDHVSVGFSSDCKNFLDNDSTASEADLSVEYKFRVSDHGGYFCIIGAGEDHPCSVREDGATYKVTNFKRWQLRTNKGWKARHQKKLSNLKEAFGLEAYGCDGCKPLENYFKFEEETNKLAYGAFADDEEWWNSKYVVWNKAYGNVLNAIYPDHVYHQDLLANVAEESGCEADDEEEEEEETAEYSDYDSFFDSVTNNADYRRSDLINPKNQGALTLESYEGAVFVLTTPSNSTHNGDFISAIKIPSNNCNKPDISGQAYPHMQYNIKLSVMDPDYAYVERMRNCDVNCEYNCADEAETAGFELVQQSSLNDDLTNGYKDFLKSDSENGRNRVRVMVRNMDVYGGIDWYVMDENGAPTYLGTVIE